MTFSGEAKPAPIKRTRYVVVGLTASLLAAPVFASENRAHDSLMSLSPSGQADMLGKMVGEGCQGETAFYMGMETEGLAKNTAYWSVKCTNSKSFFVGVDP